MNETPTFRCGWRIIQPAEIDARFDLRGTLEFPKITIQRGQFRAWMDPRNFYDMTDDEFVARMEYGYREHTFKQLQQDLDTLARQLLGQLERGGGITLTDVPYDEVKEALYRYQRVKRDTQEATT